MPVDITGARIMVRDMTNTARTVRLTAALATASRTADPALVESLNRLFGMVNEGARLLEHGIASRPSDIDITYLTGYGFPAHHGGPMYLADRIGLDRVLAEIERLHGEYGYWWTPAPLLERLVEEKRGFADLPAA